MKLIPALEIGWLNGWILLAFEFLIQGFLLLIFPKDVVSRLFDRSGWSMKQRVFTIMCIDRLMGGSIYANNIQVDPAFWNPGRGRGMLGAIW